ncbi:2TM domain-containing protein [Robertkochia sediminum]|uniref:2TM domain-containing protein n=1 Tax=Robertkochia sediminum TaxID=2785326 RepID=UPI001933EB30|nr:2TM domain-containing protein [Robertkochia sediminum]MBL7472608.1 2TM domain-containing protein [Robertkochia sediminum]
MNQFIKEFVKAFLIGVAVFLLVLGINRIYNEDFTLVFNRELGLDFLRNQVFSLLIYFGNMVVIRFLLKRYGVNLFKFRRMALAVLSSVLVTVLMIFLANAIFKIGVDGYSLEEFLAQEKVGYYRFTIILSLVITLMFYLFFYYKQKKERQVAQQQVIAGAATAQFDALKNQLDPHFLFNSLNVLSSLIEENPDAAQNFTTGLSKIYRYVLEQKSKELVSLDEELRFARTYVRLLKMRFEEGIQFEIPEAASDPDYKVVPLSLQLLLENAVKHNAVSAAEPLVIRIRENDGYLEVVNNLQPKQVIGKGSRVGLKNIADRYALLTKKEIYKDQSGGVFKVSIPLLTKKVSNMEVQEEYIENRKYLRAKERVENLKGFYWNLASYVVVIPFLAWLNYQTTSFPWVLFPMLGWGFGLAAHGMEAFGYNPIWGKRWEEKKIREIMEQENKNKNMYS